MYYVVLPIQGIMMSLNKDSLISLFHFARFSKISYLISLMRAHSTPVSGGGESSHSYCVPGLKKQRFTIKHDLARSNQELENRSFPSEAHK
jgi:hypothetical protein